MAVTYNSVDSSGDIGPSSPTTISLDVASGMSNGAVVFFINWSDNTVVTFTGATYGGDACTLVNQVDDLDLDELGVACFVLANPSSGTNNFVFTFTGTTTIGSVSVHAISLEGVHQSSPVGNDTTGTDSTSPVGASNFTGTDSDGLVLIGACTDDTANTWSASTGTLITTQTVNDIESACQYESSSTSGQAIQLACSAFSGDSSPYSVVEIVSAAPGYANTVTGVTTGNIGKVDDVATANISKVNGT